MQEEKRRRNLCAIKVSIYESQQFTQKIEKKIVKKKIILT